MSSLVIIPAHNEENTISNVLVKLKNNLPYLDILVVNDSSSDNTVKKVKELKCKLLDLPIHLGYWGALQSGLLYAFYEEYNYVITMDADGQHLPKEIPILLKAIEDKSADVVIGACLERGNILKKIAWTIFRQLTGLKIWDLTSGFRAYSKRAISLLIHEDLAVFDNADLASLIVLSQAGLKIKEVPVEMAQRDAGDSKLFSSPLKILKYLASSFILSISKRKLR
jgi:glycosyltransferase involved in cell wall biosynthesis